MCTGAEFLVAAQAFGAVAGGAAAVKSLTAKKPDTPAVVRTDPVAEDTAARTTAAQDALFQQRRKARSNSLLSQAGAAGDLSTAVTAGGAAQPKLSLGA